MKPSRRTSQRYVVAKEYGDAEGRRGRARACLTVRPRVCVRAARDCFCLRLPLAFLAAFFFAMEMKRAQRI